LPNATVGASLDSLIQSQIDNIKQSDVKQRERV
jgi:hypothetical protein